MEIKLDEKEVLGLVETHIRDFLKIPDTFDISVHFSTYGNEANILVEPKKEVADD